MTTPEAMRGHLMVVRDGLLGDQLKLKALLIDAEDSGWAPLNDAARSLVQVLKEVTGNAQDVLDVLEAGTVRLMKESDDGT